MDEQSKPPIQRDFVASLADLQQGERCQAYRRTGPGHAPALVLLHGLMDNSAGFAPLVAALAGDAGLSHDVIAPDWRGHGASTATPGEYWFPRYLADLEALLDGLAIKDPVVLVGHSMGGQIASQYAGARPERVAGLVTLDSLNVPDTDPAEAPARYRDWLDTRAAETAGESRVYADIEAFMARLARRYPELDAGALRFLAKIWLRPTDEGRLLRIDPAHRRRMPYGFRAAEAAALWREVRCPVLCLDGGQSPLRRAIGEPTLAERRACFADVEHAVLADCGHMLHIQNPSAVAARLRVFLQRIGV